MCVEWPRRLSSRITCPPSRSASSIARCSGRLIAPRDVLLWISLRRSIVRTAGMGRSSTRRGISTSRIFAALGPVPTFERRRRTGQNERHVLVGGAAHGHIARVIAGRGFLFECGFVLLVEHDQPQMRRRSEDCTAGADDDLDFAAGDPSPVFVPFDVAQMAVQDGHAIEAGAKAADGLRREADFGHEQNCLAAEADDFLDRLNVDFGFAAAGDAVDQNRAMLGRLASASRIVAQRLNLVGVEHECASPGELRCLSAADRC